MSVARLGRIALGATLGVLCACGGSSNDHGDDGSAEGAGNSSFFTPDAPSSGSSSAGGTGTGSSGMGVMCGADLPCPSGCCTPSGQCEGTLDTACGNSGACRDCTLIGETCASGACVAGTGGSGASAGASSGVSSGRSSGSASGASTGTASGSGSGSSGSGRDAGFSRDAGGSGRDSGSRPDAGPMDAGPADATVEAGADGAADATPGDATTTESGADGSTEAAAMDAAGG
ncbi:MAG TPA: hypothetical protein VKU41_31880 [Polyangiaceae bacterium]|nr:hypothetical protein [Polyangiaceae bacterium]